MAQLPIEIIEWIVSFLPENELSGYATISRDWKAVIERKTFRLLRISSSRLSSVHENLGFNSTSPDMRLRRGQIKVIEFEPILPDYDVAVCRKHETKKEQEENNKAFSQTMKSLLNTLSHWPRGENSQIRLEIGHPQSPGDIKSLTSLSGSDSTNWRAHIYSRPHLFQLRYARSYLQIEDAVEDFSLAPVVTYLSWSLDSGYDRQIAPAASSKIISRLPFLQGIFVEAHDTRKKDIALRNNIRNDFALSIATWPKSLRRLCLQYARDQPRNENLPLPLVSAPGKDPLSLVLNTLSQQLEHIDLACLLIGPELFWPESDGIQPQWPNLKTFQLSYQPATPSGEWLFDRDSRWIEPSSPYPYSGSEDSYDSRGDDLEDTTRDERRKVYFRSQPLPALEDFYLAAGRAACHMPKLESMILDGDVRMLGPGLDHLISDVPRHEFEYNRCNGRATWVSTSAFHVSDELREIWNAVARSHGHDKAEISSIGCLGSQYSYYDEQIYDPELRKSGDCFLWD